MAKRIRFPSFKVKRNDIAIVPGSAEKAYHRNGSSGNGFCVVTFDTVQEGLLHPMVAIVFKEQGNVAVFDRKQLGQGVIEFGANSWRCESFEKELRAFIGEW